MICFCYNYICEYKDQCKSKVFSLYDQFRRSLIDSLFKFEKELVGSVLVSQIKRDLR